MTEQDWDAGFAQSLTVFLNGGAITETDRRGQPIRDDSFLLLFNASPSDLSSPCPRPVRGAVGEGARHGAPATVRGPGHQGGRPDPGGRPLRCR